MSEAPRNDDIFDEQWTDFCTSCRCVLRSIYSLGTPPILESPRESRDKTKAQNRSETIKRPNKKNQKEEARSSTLQVKRVNEEIKIDRSKVVKKVRFDEELSPEKMDDEDTSSVCIIAVKTSNEEPERKKTVKSVPGPSTSAPSNVEATRAVLNRRKNIMEIVRRLSNLSECMNNARQVILKRRASTNESVERQKVTELSSGGNKSSDRTVVKDMEINVGTKRIQDGPMYHYNPLRERRTE